MTRGARYALLALVALVLIVGALSFVWWRRAHPPKRAFVDHPRLVTGVILQDGIFRSRALGRDMRYRVLMPADVDKPLPVIYLLHGGGGDYRDWTNYADIAQFAKHAVLVMPEGDDSYWTNSATKPADRYEDYVLELIPEVERKLPVLHFRSSRAIAGVSMGGYGAVKIALHHPELFGFVGGVSPALDVPRRQFSWKRIEQWRYHSGIFGPMGSETRSQNDPYVLIRSADAKTLPYFYLTCGDQEGLLPANRDFAAALKARGAAYEFHAGPGAHDWNQWNARFPALFEAWRVQGLPPAASK